MSVSEREERLAQIRERLEKVEKCDGSKGLELAAAIDDFDAYVVEDVRWLLERLEQAEGIVRELATVEATNYDEVMMSHHCAWCDAKRNLRTDEITHTESCPYRRALAYLKR